MLKGYAVNQRILAPQILQKQIGNVDTRLTAVEHEVDFFINTVHSAQNQKIEQLSNDVQKVMENFIDPSTYKHFLIFDGQKLEADVAYIKIYGMAKKSITIIDIFSKAESSVYARIDIAEAQKKAWRSHAITLALKH